MSNFFVNQSLSVNQRRNPRLNEYFAVVGLPDGPLLLSDPPPNAPPVSGSSPGRAPLQAPATATVDKIAGAVEGADGRVGEVTVGEKRDGDAAGMGSGGEVTAVVVGGGSPSHSTSASKSSSNTACTSELNSTSTSTSSSNATTEAAVAEASGATAPVLSSSTPSSDDAPRPGGGDAIPPAPLTRLGSLPPARKRTYGSCELGIIRAKAADAGIDGPLHSRFRARVVHRFPGYDHEGDGCAFPANLPLFCLPAGLKLSLEMALPTFFTFVHTRANGQHMFGYCLCLHEPLEKRHRTELQKLVDTHNKAGDWAAGQEGTETAGFLQTLDPEREVYAPKCLCLLSTWPHFGPFREWLLNLYRISLSPFQIPLERHIGNFLLEVPTPSPGRVEVLYNMGNTTITFACPPPNKPVTWGSVPFEPLFKCLSHDNILTLFSYLLLERSILLKSSQLSLLTPCAEVLALVLYPLSWSHVYIPVLPEALLGVLAAPMPFLIGVHRSFVEDTEMDVAPYVVQVDLDNDVVEMGLDSPIPALPPKRRAKLLSKLGEHAQLSHCRTPEYRQDMMQKSDLAFSMAIRPCDFDDDEPDVQLPDWDAVREAFLRFFVALLCGYRRCLVYPTKANPNPARLFNVDDFLDKLERDSRPFAEAMCDTQAFQNFIDARIQPEAGDLDVVFFDACIAAKRNRSLLHVTKKSDASFLRPDTFVKAKTVFALTPDTTGLDMDAPPKSHDRFPSLSPALYPIPRDIPSLSNPTNHDSGGATKGRSGGGNSGGGGGNSGSSAFSKYFSRKGDGDGNAGSGGEGGGSGGGGRRGSTSLGGGRGVFARGASSRSADDDWAPLPAEATVFAVFLVGFCATIGVDPPAAKRGSGALASASLPVESVPPPPSPPPPTAAAPAAAETAVPMPPALEVTTLPEPSAATSTNSVPAQDTPSQASPPTPPEGDAADVGVEGTGADTPAAAEEDGDDVLGLQQQERGPAEEDGSSLASSWGSGRGPARAPASSDAGGALSAASVATAGIDVSAVPLPLVPAGLHASAAASDGKREPVVGSSGGGGGDTLAVSSAESLVITATADAATAPATAAAGTAPVETEPSGAGRIGASVAADVERREVPPALGAGEGPAAPEVGPSPPKGGDVGDADLSAGDDSDSGLTAGEPPPPLQPAQADEAATAEVVGSAPGVVVENDGGKSLPVEAVAVPGATTTLASAPPENASGSGGEGGCGVIAGDGSATPAPTSAVPATSADGVSAAADAATPAAGAAALPVEKSSPPPLPTAEATKTPPASARTSAASGEGGDNFTDQAEVAANVGGSRVQEIPVGAGAAVDANAPFSNDSSSGSSSGSASASASASASSSSSSLAAPPALLPALSITSVPAASPVPAATATAGASDGGVGGKAGSDTGAGKTRKSSRLPFSELKHDVREERLYKANAALAVAFEALEAMREKAPAGEEAVYRSLISACGRCGNSEKAMAVVEMMMSTGIVPDAMVSRCLVDAFAMDDSFSDGGAHPLSLLDWSKFQPRHREGRRSHESSGRPSSDTSFSFKRMMKRFNDKSETSSPALSPSPAAIAAEPAPPTTTTATTTTTFTAKAAAGSVVLSPFDTPTRPARPPSYAALVGATTSGRAALASSDGGGDSRKASMISDVGSASAVSQARDSFGMAFHSPEGRHPPLLGSLERGRRAVAESEEEDTRRRSTDLRRRLERSASPYSRRGGMSVEMQQQVLLGERLLESLFPELKIDNGSETCPACQAELSGEQVRDGWSSDPNDYTTECRAIVDLQAAALAAAAGASASSGWGGGGGGGGAGDGAAAGGDTASGSGAGGGTGASAMLPASRSGSTAGGATGRRKSSAAGLPASRTAKGTSVVCGRRFVSRFSVHSTAAGWEGTTGPGTPLWCEYLPPWVLRKEFHTILAAYGVQYLCSERFRRGLGPAEDTNDPTGGGRFSMGGDGVRGSGQRAVGASRAVDRTVFWNLVVHFREHCLPITFLLADASMAVGPVLVGSSLSLVAAE